MYRFSISVNPSDLIDVDPELGDCVLHDPLRAAALFQSVSELTAQIHVDGWNSSNLHLILFLFQVCFLAIKTLSLVEKICTESQVWIFVTEYQGIRYHIDLVIRVIIH